LQNKRKHEPQRKLVNFANASFLCAAENVHSLTYKSHQLTACVENAQDAVLFTCCLHFVLCLSQVAGAGAETAPEEALARVFL